ncbi:uncharacterized protein LOC110094562 [Dendrobium catenatum]|uniref:uncharacterized protein LOC110094562 n=1 Tax=Dendrobium catenatum TaxID=906689 RepID=UPI0010A07EA0|nr:uncharacterized protein LOC110094562 [Dendrobium catenatum]
MALKVDMEQDYDCMSWDTLHRVMDAMGFLARFSRWVLACVCEPRFAFLLNGNRSHWINAHSGLRQGCLLSPYLFILCSELLTKAFNQSGAGLGVQIVINGKRVSHLLYVDDILVFAEASLANAKCIYGILADYCGWTGKKININKSAIIFNKRCPRWKGRRIARLLGYKMVSSLDYLGIPLLTRRLLKADYAKTVTKAVAKINVWGKRHLSLAGRATIIRTSLLSVPMYCMTLTGIPRGSLEFIEKIGRQFLWRKNSNSRGLHYVAWSELCKPTEMGGLGFHSSVDWIGPLRARLALNFIQQPDTLLHHILREKYGDNPWVEWPGRNVSISWQIMNDGANALRTIIRWKIGDGKTVNVLSDIWVLDRQLDEWPAYGDLSRLEHWQVSQLFTENGDWDAGLLGQWGFHMPAAISFDAMIRNLEEMAGHNPGLGRIFCSAVYHAWRARNDKKHGRNWGSPTIVAATVLGAFAKPHLMPFVEQWHINQPPGLSVPPKWCVPPPNWLKFNFDASLLSSNLAGLSLVVRDHCGNLIVATGQQLEHWDAATAKLLAVSTIKNVIDDWMLDRAGIIIEGDCSNIIEWLEQLRHHQHNLHRRREGPDFSFFTLFQQVLFNRVPRCCNRAADFCARRALEGNFTWKNVWGDDIPCTFVSLLREESVRS